MLYWLRATIDAVNGQNGVDFVFENYGEERTVDEANLISFPPSVAIFGLNRIVTSF